MTKNIVWNEMPYYTAQKIIKQLSYKDIYNVTLAIPFLDKIFEETNKLPKTKFIFDSNIDSLDMLETCDKICEIYINLKKIEQEEFFQCIPWINNQMKLNTLHIKDTYYVSQLNFIHIPFGKSLTNLSHLTYQATADWASQNRLTALLIHCHRLQEFTFEYGTLTPCDMKQLRNLKKLRLINVNIECEIKFGTTLRAMGRKLQHFEHYEDIHTCKSILQAPYDIIYQNLEYLTSIHTLKIMALKNSKFYTNLRKLREIQNLKIITLKNNFLPRLYHVISQISAEKIEIEDWTQPNIYKPMSQMQVKSKEEGIKNMLTNKPHLIFSEKYSKNPRKRIPLY